MIIYVRNILELCIQLQYVQNYTKTTGMCARCHSTVIPRLTSDPANEFFG